MTRIKIGCIFLILLSLIACDRKNKDKKRKLEISLNNANVTFFKDHSLNDRENVPSIPYIIFVFDLYKTTADTTIIRLGGEDDNLIAFSNGEKISFRKDKYILSKAGFHNVLAGLDYHKTVPDDTFDTKAARIQYMDKLIKEIEFFYIDLDTTSVDKSQYKIAYIDEADSAVIIN